MTTKLRKLKQTAMAICCVAGLGALPAAYADGFSVSIGSGPYYYNGYRYAYPARRCFYDAYGYYRCRPVYPPYAYTYYDNGYYYNGYAPGIALGYYGHYGDRDDWRWRDRDDRRWRDRDHDGDRNRDWRH